MNFDVITIMPQLFETIFSAGIMRKAIEKKLIAVQAIDLRKYTSDKHKSVDDTTYGGGYGMVFKPEPIDMAIQENRQGHSCVILLSAQGKLYNQRIAESLVQYEQIMLICGRYEGCDERVAEQMIDMELSIGDYVLHGGEIAAMVVIESVSRLLPGVIGKEESTIEESFQNMLLDYPHYTKPASYKGVQVPKVLLSGHHEKIKKWRYRKALEKTLQNRPDLIVKKLLHDEGKQFWDYLQELFDKE